MVVFSKPLAGIAGTVVLVSVLKAYYGSKKEKIKRAESSNNNAKVDWKFVQRMIYVIKHILPGMVCKETVLMAALMVALLGRTWMSLWIAWNMGKTVQDVCYRRFNNAARNVAIFGGVTTIAALINSLLKYLQSTLALSLRTRFVKKVQDEYMKRNNYYRVNKLGSSDTRVVLADQLMTEDIKRWSNSFAEVYSAVFKPIVDFFLFSFKLAKLTGIQGPLGMYAWFMIAAGITTSTLPPFGKLLAREQELEGQFRDAHQKLITNSEMVAFMRGEVPESNFLSEKFAAIRKHVKLSNFLKWKSDLIMGYVNKYVASVVGFLLMARPIAYGDFGLDKADAGAIAAHYVASRQIMENLSNAVLALFEVQKKVGNLSGLTMRVYDLLYKLQNSSKIFEEFSELCPSPEHTPTFVDSDHLKFENVAIYRPDGALLAKNLTFDVPHMRKIIITGPNGCGKSSLFRVLRGLWPLLEGTIHRPKDSDIYFLSQVNFVPRGTLKQLLTYPHSAEKLEELRISDEYLWECLELAHLKGFEAQGVQPQLETILDWDVALSPGQKQRMAFARLLYHRPKYAVLDECTNGISPDVERDLYKRCELLGISVFSISHKEDLKRFHNYELHYIHDKKGSYEWKPLEIELNIDASSENSSSASSNASVSPSAETLEPSQVGISKSERVRV